MAATSTNKQPLLVDHVLHKVIDLSLSYIDGINVDGTNSAELIVDSTSLDGAVIEDVYAISKSTDPFTVNLYISSSNDYLRPQEGVFIGQLTAATTVGVVTHWEEMPRCLAPVPQVGDNPYNQALYIPKGRALWAAFDGTASNPKAPILGCQGGWY